MSLEASLHVSKNAMRLACPEPISWVKDSAGILVVDERREEVHVLRGLECAVWSWLSLEYSFSDLLALVAELLGASEKEAQQRLVELLQTWMSAGLLEEESEPGFRAVQKNCTPIGEELGFG